MSKIRVLIHRLDIHNIQTKTVSFPDQEKFLKELVFISAVSMNANTENSQIKHCPCLKDLVIYRPDLTIYWPGKTYEKRSRVKFYLLKYATIENFQYQHCQKNARKS